MKRLAFALVAMTVAQAGCASLVGIGDPTLVADSGTEDATASDAMTPHEGGGDGGDSSAPPDAARGDSSVHDAGEDARALDASEAGGCTLGQTRCSGDGVQKCTASGAWGPAESCGSMAAAAPAWTRASADATSRPTVPRARRATPSSTDARRAARRRRAATGVLLRRRCGHLHDRDREDGVRGRGRLLRLRHDLSDRRHVLMQRDPRVRRHDHPRVHRRGAELHRPRGSEVRDHRRSGGAGRHGRRCRSGRSRRRDDGNDHGHAARNAHRLRRRQGGQRSRPTGGAAGIRTAEPWAEPAPSVAVAAAVGEAALPM